MNKRETFEGKAGVWYSTSQFMPEPGRMLKLRVKTSNGIVEVEGTRHGNTMRFSSPDPIEGDIFGITEWMYI